MIDLCQTGKPAAAAFIIRLHKAAFENARIRQLTIPLCIVDIIHHIITPQNRVLIPDKRRRGSAAFRQKSLRQYHASKLFVLFKLSQDECMYTHQRTVVLVTFS